MKKIQNISVLLLAFILFSCPTKTKENTTATEVSTKESRTVDLKFTLDAQYDETIALKPMQDIIQTYSNSTLEITVEPPFKETIAGLTVQEGSYVKFEFEDVTKCHPEDECRYTAILSIYVDNVVVSTANFPCSYGQGSGYIDYTFE